MDDFAALMRLVEKCGPADDPTPLLIAADCCGDQQGDGNGDDWRMLAYALRWCAADGRRPFFRAEIKRFPWEWYRHQSRYQGLTGPQVNARAFAQLPAPLFDVLRELNDTDHPWCCAWKTAEGAYRILGEALEVLREVYEHSALPPKVVKPVEVKLVTCRQCGIARDARGPAECPVCRATEVLG